MKSSAYSGNFLKIIFKTQLLIVYFLMIFLISKKSICVFTIKNYFLLILEEKCFLISKV